MDHEKKKALEAAGWKFGDAAELLGMNAEERQVLDARVELALTVRRLRRVHGLTQKQLADRMKTSQPRVAKIERAADDVSIDQILHAITAVGGRFRVKQIVQVGRGKTHHAAGTKKLKAVDKPRGTDVLIEVAD
jgi:transcriptional regulator